MINAMPTLEEPDWLMDLTEESIANDPLPLEDLLKDSLYYPSSEFDGDPVKYLGGNILSFVYVDYGVGKDQLTQELSNPGFLGYRPVGSRAVQERELVPNGWRPSMPLDHDGDWRSAELPVEQPFCLWTVFEREPDMPDDHGPARFSLLYLYADGAAAFQALYVSNRAVPKVVAVIQPGHSFGGNWTDFADPARIFARLILGNPKGMPQWLMYGGIGPRSGYRKSCWPFYRELKGFFEKAGGGSIGLWSSQ